MHLKTLRLVVVAIALAPASCRCSGEDPGSSSSAPSAPAAAHSAPQQAIAHCRAGAQRAEGATSSERFAIVAEACAGIFAERGCRDAWLAAAKADPTSKISGIVKGCRAAYCPVLPAPKPVLCEARFEGGGGPSELWKHWPDFFAAMLERDLGADRVAAREALDGFVVPMEPTVIEVPQIPLPDGGALPVTVRVRCPADCALELEDGDGRKLGRWSVQGNGKGPGMAQMAKAAAQAAEGRAVAIQADPQVRYAIVIALMDALRAEGLDQVSMSVERAGDGG